MQTKIQIPTEHQKDYSKNNNRSNHQANQTITHQIKDLKIFKEKSKHYTATLEINLVKIERYRITKNYNATRRRKTEVSRKTEKKH